MAGGELSLPALFLHDITIKIIICIINILIVINNTIEYAFKDIFLSNHNIVSFHNMSLGESEHVLVKK